MLIPEHMPSSADVYKGVWLKGKRFIMLPAPLTKRSPSSAFCDHSNVNSSFSHIFMSTLFIDGTQFFLPLTWWRTPKERLIERLCFISTTRETENWQNNDTSMQLKQSHNLCQHTTRFGDILIQPIFMMCWDIGDDYVFFLVRSDQSERITRMAITWSFSCSGSVSALLRQICRTNWDICGAYWRHNATQGADIHSSLFVTKSVTFVSHQNVCVTQRGVHPPSSSLRMLPQFEDFGKQRSVYANGGAGGGEGGHTWQ